MSTHAGVGSSREADSQRAGASAVRAAIAQAGVERPDVVLLYATIRHDPEALLRGATSAAAGAKIIGCSAQGVSVAGSSVEAKPVAAAMALQSDEIAFETAVIEGVGARPREVGLEAARKVSGGAPPTVLICHWDPLTGVDVDQLILGLSEAGTTNVIGGAAAQTWGPVVATWQLGEGRVLEDSLIVLAMRGASAILDTSHGAEPIGLEMRVTRAKGNVLYELDGRRALDVWNEMTGGGDRLRAEQVGAWVLGIKLPDDMPAHYGGCLTRVVYGVEAESGGLVLQVPIPEGTDVLICHRTIDATRKGAAALAVRMKEALAGKRPHFALAFECGGRTAPFLGEDEACREAEEVRSVLGADVPWLGMYAWGEIAPIGGRVVFHQLTLPLCVIH